MRKFLTTLLLIAGLFQVQSVLAQAATWLNTYYDNPSPAPGSPYISGVFPAVDEVGFTYLAINAGEDLYVKSQLYPSQQFTNATIVKLNPNGDTVWVKQLIPDNNSVQFNDLKIDKRGNLYALGNFYSYGPLYPVNNVTIDGVTLTGPGQENDYFLAKWNSSGVLEWAVNGGGVGKRQPRSLAITTEGEVIVGGQFSSQSGFGSFILSPVYTTTSLYNCFLLKYSASGAIQWAKAAEAGTSASRSEIQKVGLDQSNNIYLLGNHIFEISFGNLVIPFPTSTPSQNRHFWLKLDPHGNPVAYQHMGSQQGTSRTMVVDDLGFSYICGRYGNGNDTIDVGGVVFISPNGSVSSYVAKYDPSGILQWAKPFTTSGPDDQLTISSLALDNLGNLFVSGGNIGEFQIENQLVLYAPTAPSNIHGFVASLDQFTGAFNKVLTASCSTIVSGTNSPITGGKVACNSGGQLVFGGIFSGTIKVGNLESPMEGNPVRLKAFISRITNNYNSVTGTVFVDSNSNGILDATENGLSTGTQVGVSPGNFAYNTNSSGDYFAITNIGNYTISLANPLIYYTALPTGSTTVSFSNFGNTAPGRDFALQPIPNQQDLQVNITALQPPRPGFPVNYRITYKNPGTVAIPSGTVSLAFDPLFTFLSSSQTASQSGNTLTWNFSNLQPMEIQNINVLLSLTAVAPLGDSVACTASITPVSGDLTPANNTETSERLIVGSYDPNSIEVNYEQLTLQQLQSGQKLNYTIRFQNMGTDTAFTVMLRDSIPAYLLNLGSIEFVASSHSCSYTLDANGILTVMFTNIRLPHQGINSIGSNGFVRFQIKPFASLAVGDIIPNQAHIYFDYNAPITTNTAETEVIQLSAVAGQLNPNVLQLYPNPATNAVTVRALSGGFAGVNLRVLNALGQQVYSRSMQSAEAGFEHEISLRHLPTGVYSVQLQTEQGSVVKRLVKQ